MTGRRNPFASGKAVGSGPTPPGIYDQLRVATPRKRDRHWEKEHLSHKAVYRGVDPKLALRVKEVAADIQVGVGEVARFLLEYALGALSRGELELNPTPNPARMRMTLFPQKAVSQRADLCYTPRKNKAAKPAGACWRVITTWRNFPPALKGQLNELASEQGLNVPVGELITALLRFSLKAYEYGLLKLEPVEKVTGYQLEATGPG
jgi:hypothetical protein